MAFGLGQETIVVTRHPALLQHLEETGLVPPGTPVISHVTDPSQIAGKHVIGILPLHLAQYAAKVTEIPMTYPQEHRGKEFTIEETRRFAGSPRTYRVERIEGLGFIEISGRSTLSTLFVLGIFGLSIGGILKK